MSRCICPPMEFDGHGPSLFLAGGITGCANWQDKVVSGLSDQVVTLLNPRRADFPSGDPTAARAQIAWEHRALRQASAILLWFPSESLCPIALYELGAWSMTSKPLFVGTHRGNARRTDVIIQTSLACPDVVVADDLDELIGQARAWLERHQ